LFLAGWGAGYFLPYKVAQDRMIWHDKIDQAQQRLIDLGGGKDDSVIRLTKDETINLQITDALAARSMTCNSKLNSTRPSIPMAKSDTCGPGKPPEWIHQGLSGERDQSHPRARPGAGFHRGQCPG